MEEKILNVLVSMQSDFYDMKNDINDIKKDVSGMKVEINEMKQDISGMKVEINEMKQDIKQLNVRMDRLETKEQKGTGFIFVVAKINPVPNFKILVLYLFF